MWSEALGGLDHASLASELAPIGGGCCLADCHSLRRLHPMTGFFRAPPYGDRTHNLPNRQAAARARRAKPGAKRRQGRAKRMPRQGGLRVGVGARVGAVGRDQPTAEGVRAGRFNQTVPPNPPNTPAPQHPRQRKPSVAPPRRVPQHPSIQIHSIGEQLGMGSTAIGSSLAVGRLKELGASGSQSRARPSRAVLRLHGCAEVLLSASGRGRLGTIRRSRRCGSNSRRRSLGSARLSSAVDQRSLPRLG